MAKFQLVEFLRKVPTEKFKSDIVWERGIALLNEFDDVHVIIDCEGNKLKKEPYRFRQLIGQGFTHLDTEAAHVTSF